MDYITVDLGTTNIKVAAYDQSLSLKGWKSVAVEYERANGFCEFDVDAYTDQIYKMISNMVSEGVIESLSVSRIVFTGQAESLVVLDEDKKPLMNAISWMDGRSEDECGFLGTVFSEEEFYKKTGQLAIIPTWPAAKILWIKNNSQELHSRIKHYVLLKDYVVYKFTGILCADCSIATFSFYFDIWNKCYWKEMCKICGIDVEKLPSLTEPCTDIGPLSQQAAFKCGLHDKTIVNNGTLDHFAGMIGSGNIETGIMSLSTGTVMALATIAPSPVNSDTKMALHYGFIPGTYVYLLVAESGGANLEWYKNMFMPDISYNDMNEKLEDRSLPNEVIFLPYIDGTNSPEYDENASGLFYGLKIKHDRLDLAYAVMEGVAMMLAKNVEALQDAGVSISRIIATGGGAKSEIWCQLQADMSGVPIQIPEDKEAANLGAAIIGAVADGSYKDYTQAVQKAVGFERTYHNKTNDIMIRKRTQFDLLYKAMIEANRLK